MTWVSYRNRWSGNPLPTSGVFLKTNRLASHQRAPDHHSFQHHVGCCYRISFEIAASFHWKSRRFSTGAQRKARGTERQPIADGTAGATCQVGWFLRHWQTALPVVCSDFSFMWMICVGSFKIFKIRAECKRSLACEGKCRSFAWPMRSCGSWATAVKKKGPKAAWFSVPLPNTTWVPLLTICLSSFQPTDVPSKTCYLKVIATSVAHWAIKWGSLPLGLRPRLRGVHCKR